MPLNVIPTSLPEVLILEPEVFEDERGEFFESYNAKDFTAATGRKPGFVQDNQSRSRQNVLRGLHYQIGRPQGKLVRVVSGEIFDVAVDLRRRSSCFGQWVGIRLSAESHRQLWVPEGFAHGFLVLSESADILYKTTDYRYPEGERGVIWNDEALGIEWPTAGNVIMSTKDRNAVSFAAADVFA